MVTIINETKSIVKVEINVDRELALKAGSAIFGRVKIDVALSALTEDQRATLAEHCYYDDSGGYYRLDYLNLWAYRCDYDKKIFKTHQHIETKKVDIASLDTVIDMINAIPAIVENSAISAANKEAEYKKAALKRIVDIVDDLRVYDNGYASKNFDGIGLKTLDYLTDDDALKQRIKDKIAAVKTELELKRAEIKKINDAVSEKYNRKLAELADEINGLDIDGDSKAEVLALLK